VHEISLDAHEQSTGQVRPVHFKWLNLAITETGYMLNSISYCSSFVLLLAAQAHLFYGDYFAAFHCFVTGWGSAALTYLLVQREARRG